MKDKPPLTKKERKLKKNERKQKTLISKKEKEVIVNNIKIKSKKGGEQYQYDVHIHKHPKDYFNWDDDSIDSDEYDAFHQRAGEWKSGHRIKYIIENN